MDKDSKEETEAKAEVVNEELKDESQPMETSLAENIVAEQEKEEFEQMEGISSKVNQELSAQLQEMGFHKNSCEKAIFMTGNSSLEKALEWLEAHQDDPDFLDELRIVKTEISAPNEPPKSALSKEEAAIKAKELQAEMRKKYEVAEKARAEETEKNRMESGKLLTEARAKLEEGQLKRDLDAKKKEKMKDALDKQRMLEQLARDKEERFGKKFAPGGVGAIVEKSPAEKARGGIKTVQTLYPHERNPKVAETCFKTIKIYLTNVIKDPTNEKFLMINKENKAFKSRVGEIAGGIPILKAAGYQENEDMLVLAQVDINTIKLVYEELLNVSLN